MDVREKGHRWERAVVKLLKNMGFNKAVTSRANNKILDACKVDIDRVPFYIQCKNGYPKGINYSKLIKEMADAIREEYGKLQYPIIVMHKKGRDYEDNLVIMPFKDFMNLLNQIPYDIQGDTPPEPKRTKAIGTQS